jgi:hypothetical protein
LQAQVSPQPQFGPQLQAAGMAGAAQPHWHGWRRQTLQTHADVVANRFVNVMGFSW